MEDVVRVRSLGNGDGALREEAGAARGLRYVDADDRVHVLKKEVPLCVCVCEQRDVCVCVERCVCVCVCMCFDVTYITGAAGVAAEWCRGQSFIRRW